MKMHVSLLAQLFLSLIFVGQASAQSITPRVCIESSFGGFNAVFGYESREPNPATILVGPSNNLSSVPANPADRLHTVFYPGFQEGFAIYFFPTAANPTLTWTLQGQSVSANWNTELCERNREADLAIALSDGVNVVLPGTNVTYTIIAQNMSLDANQDVFATVSDAFPVQCSSVNWTCRGEAGSTCTAAGTGDIDELVFLPPLTRVTFLATCALGASASGSLTNAAGVSSEKDLTLDNNQASDVNSIVSAIFSISSASVVEGNSGATSMTLTVTRTSGAAGGGTQTVNVASGSGATGGSATAGVDYTPLANTVLSFTPGVNTRTVSVQILGDTQDELDETVNLILSSPSSGTGFNNATGVGTIVDDDAEPSSTNIVSDLPDPSVSGENYAVNVTVTGTRSAPLGTVNVSDGAVSCVLNLTTSNALSSTGSCNIRSLTAGNKTLSASYLPASSAFAASQDTEAHEVRLAEFADGFEVTR